MSSNKTTIVRALQSFIEEEEGFDFEQYFDVENDFKVLLKGLELRDAILSNLGYDPDKTESLFREAARILFREYQDEYISHQTELFKSKLSSMSVSFPDFKKSIKLLLSNTYSSDTNENVYKLCTWVQWSIRLWIGEGDTQGYMLNLVSQDSTGDKKGKVGKGFSLKALRDVMEGFVEKSVGDFDVPTTSYGFDTRLSRYLLAMVTEADYKGCDFEYWQNSIDGQSVRTKGKYLKAISMKPKASWICSSNQEITYSNWRRYLQIFYTDQLYKDNQQDVSKELGIVLSEEQSAELLRNSWKTVFCFIYQYGIPSCILQYEPSKNVRRNLALKNLLQLYLQTTETNKTGLFYLKYFKAYIQEIDKDNFYGKYTLQQLGNLVEQLGCTHTASAGKPKPYGEWQAPESILVIEEKEPTSEVHLVFEAIDTLLKGVEVYKEAV